LSATTDRLQANILKQMGATKDQDLLKRVQAAFQKGNVKVIYFLAGQAQIGQAKRKVIEARIQSELESFLRAQYGMKPDEAKAVVGKVTVEVQRV
jgi:hypothetical protein